MAESKEELKSLLMKVKKHVHLYTSLKLFSHLFFKLLLLYFYVLVLHYLSIAHTAWLVGS